MELVTLYEKCKESETWFSLTDRCGDWVEIIGKHKFFIPEGFEVCEDMAGEAHFYVKGYSSDHAEIGIDKNGFPYLCGMLHSANGRLRNPDERVYLKRPTNNKERPNDIEFFQLQISAEGDRFAYHGTVCDINEYADNEVIMGEAAELGVSPEEYIKENPEQAAVLLVENFGYGAMEFSATNKDGQGAYSMNPNDFKVSEQELAEFMAKVGLPDDVIPSFEYELTSRYGKDATEDTFKTNDWSEVEEWSHEKLMDGFEVEINDVKYSQSAELDPDRYQDTFDLRNGEFPVDEQYMNVDYGDDKELE